MRHIVKLSVTLFTLAFAWGASAQNTIQAVPLPIGVPASGQFNAFPAQNPLGPVGKAQQVNYPYPGQCVVTQANKTAWFPLLPLCTATGSFDGAQSQRTAGGWAATGLVPFFPLNPILPNSVPLAGVAKTEKFVQPLLNPPDYTPDGPADVWDPAANATIFAKFPGAEYYEIGLHEAWGFQAIASAGLFPNPLNAAIAPAVAALAGVPDGMQWTGLRCNNVSIAGAALPCSCPADASASFKATYCTAPGGLVPHGAPLYTPIWGVGQINKGGGPVTSTLSAVSATVNGPKLFTPAAAGPFGSNSYIATWPSISIRAKRGTPVVVKWVNEFPNSHVLCPHAEAADWPCAIDRTFMGVKARVDPALQHAPAIPPEGVNQYGSPQQPDNSWVTHLHGGEIPPSTDGFAEKWFGNKVTGPLYQNTFVNPPFEAPPETLAQTLKRPALGPDKNYDVYTYPMVQEEATIWFHDHTLGKTHHNVIAGPAGFFPVKEPKKHGGVGTGANKCPAGYAPCTTEYTWLDPVTEPRNDLGVPLYDLFLAVQDRAFNDDGSINFSNALGQALPVPPPAVLPIGFSSVTPGTNPQVHPTWVPEYFGDHALVNGVLWPTHKAVPGWYRLRIVDGSDSRCWTVGFSTILPAPGTKPTPNVPFFMIANDQGYLQNPVRATTFTMCPGERYELLINFGAIAGATAPAGVNVYMTNSAAAPFPAGITPFAVASPFAELNTIMSFNVNTANAIQPLTVFLNNVQTTLQLGGAPVKSCAAATNWDPTWTQAQMQAAIVAGSACMPASPLLAFGAAGDPGYNARNQRPLAWPLAAGTVATVRQVYLNERVDGVTLAPFGMQLNGVPFEYKVTETPLKDTVEYWQFVNLTVDAHPMHPHLVQHQIVARQNFNVGRYKATLCGSTTCQPGPVPGGEMQVVPDVTAMLTGTPTLVTAASVEGGFKDATQVPPGKVTTIVALWGSRWDKALAQGGAGAGVVLPPAIPTVPSVVNAEALLLACPGGAGCDSTAWTYEDVTQGPYVWHCHINSHEDSEMMRTSLVVK